MIIQGTTNKDIEIEAVGTGNVTLTAGGDQIVTPNQLKVGGTTTVSIDLSTGLTNHYKLNDDAASTAVDDSAGINNGTADRNTDQFSVAGKINKALDFNGTSDLVDLPTQFTNSVGSIAFWIYPDAAGEGDFRGIFTQGNTGDINESFWIALFSNNTIDFRIQSSAGNDVDVFSIPTIPSDTWTHVTLVNDGTNYKMYFNGGEVDIDIDEDGTARAGDWFDTIPTTDVTTIGALIRTSEGNWFDGKIDDLRIYNTVLDQARINTIYNNGNGEEGTIITFDINAIGTTATLSPTFVGSGKDNLIIEKDLEVQGSGYFKGDSIFESTKIKMFPSGAIAIKLTNKTGSNSVAGQIVKPDDKVDGSGGVDDAFITILADDQEIIGIVAEAGVSDGSEAWVVGSGIADVLMDAGGSARGDRIISSATAGSGDVWNVGGAVATHFQEIGHCIEDRTGAGLARCVLHFN